MRVDITQVTLADAELMLPEGWMGTKSAALYEGIQCSGRQNRVRRNSNRR